MYRMWCRRDIVAEQQSNKQAARKRNDMRGRHKTFDQGLYKTYDTPGIAAVLAHLEEQGTFAKVGADKYGVDIVVYQGLRPIQYIEVEVVSAWTGGPFPWSHCHVLERKGKWMRGDLGLPCTIYRLSSTFSHAILIPDHVVTEDQLQEVRNRLVPEGELMYRVPTDLLDQIELECGREEVDSGTIS